MWRNILKLLGEDGVAAITIIIYTQFLLTALYIGFSMGVAGVRLAVPIAELITMVVALIFLYRNKDRYHYA